MTFLMTSVRDAILTRYAMFLQSIRKNNSTEIRILASISYVDGRCITGSNMMKMSRERLVWTWWPAVGTVLEVLSIRVKSLKMKNGGSPFLLGCCWKEEIALRQMRTSSSWTA